MKTSSFVILLAVSALSISTTSHARCNEEAERIASSLDHLSDGIASEFRSAVGYRRICQPEQRFMDTVHSLQGLSDRLHYGLEDGENPACLERTFCSIKRTFSCVKEQANELRIGGCIREMICKYDRSISALDSIGLGPRYEEPRRSYREEPSYQRSYSQRPTVARPEAAIAQGLLRLFQGR